MGRTRHLFSDDSRDEAIWRRQPGVSARWERADPEEPRHLPILLRQASHAIDRMIVRALSAVVEPHLGRLTDRTMVDVDLLWRLMLKPSSPTALAEYLDRHRSSVGHRIDRLEKLGLVRRTGHHRDARACIVGLTDAGEELMSEVEQALGELADEISEDLPPTQWPQLLTQLAVLADVR